MEKITKISCGYCGLQFENKINVLKHCCSEHGMTIDAGPKSWPVVRFPNGDWSGGGKFDDPDYAYCEKWLVVTRDFKAGVKIAQSARAKQRRKEKRA